MFQKYHAIGEKFRENDTELVVVKDIDGLENNCDLCYFNNRSDKCCEYMCTFEYRDDGEDVHFIETCKIS